MKVDLMNIYLLKEYGNGEQTSKWSHSKLDLIHDGQQSIKDRNVERAQVYKVSITEKTPRLLVIRLLNKQPLDRSYELVWQQKAKQDTTDYPEIEPAVAVV